MHHTMHVLEAGRPCYWPGLQVLGRPNVRLTPTDLTSEGKSNHSVRPSRQVFHTPQVH